MATYIMANMPLTNCLAGLYCGAHTMQHPLTDYSFAAAALFLEVGSLVRLGRWGLKRFWKIELL